MSERFTTGDADGTIGLIATDSSYLTSIVAKARAPKKKPRRLRVRYVWWMLAVIAAVSAGLIACDWWVGSMTEERVHDRIADLQPAPVALLLGTSPRTAGRPNPFYSARIKAAQELFAAGKVQGILVSGDNRRANYNEPVMMKADLIRAGVPAEFITSDFAGFRTLDSVVRAKTVFQQQRVIIVSQRFHAQRALFLAQHVGLEAEAYAAEEPQWSWWIRARVREVFARTLACLDVWVLNRQPHFLGPVQPVKLRSQPHASDR